MSDRDEGPRRPTGRLRSHPQVRQKLDLVSRRPWVFTCAICEADFYLRAARLQSDGALLCGECAGDPPLRRTTTWWCPSCKRAQPVEAFESESEPVAQVALGRSFRREPRPTRLCAECRDAPLERHVFECLWCEESFSALRSDARYCSTRCRVAAHRAR